MRKNEIPCASCPHCFFINEYEDFTDHFAVYCTAPLAIEWFQAHIYVWLDKNGYRNRPPNTKHISTCPYRPRPTIVVCKKRLDLSRYSEVSDGR